MTIFTQLKESVISLGYPEEGVEEAYEKIRIQHLQHADLRMRILNCQSCSLAKQCKTPVAGSLMSSSKIMIVGDMPEKEDVELGVPFAGVSGFILTIILDKMNINREDLYLTNMVKCNKTDGRISVKDAETCLGHFYREIALVKPEVIVSFGQVPLTMLTKSKSQLKDVRGQWLEEVHTPIQIPVMPTHHPRYLQTLKGRELLKAKKEIWGDLQSVFERIKL